MNKRIVITGIGVISSIGIGRDAFWPALLKGVSGISEITSFDTSNYPTHNGGEVKDFDPALFIAKNKIANLGRTSCLAIASAKLALKDAGLKAVSMDHRETGVILGTTMGESQVLEVINSSWIKGGVNAINPELIFQYPANVLAFNVANELGISGPNLVIPTACAAGNYAIGYACDLIRMGQAEMMLAGGVDAFSRLAFTGFNRLLAVAPVKCQPFDKNRKGMMVGEGAGIVVLESMENALNRKAVIYAEVLGYGLSCDAYHMTAPEADGVARSMRNALKQANVKAEDVDYVSAHGTGTPVNDKVESAAIKAVFAGIQGKVAVSSIKSMLGHTMGAASAIEAITCALALQNDIVPPTINYQTPDPECDIDCVPNVARQMKVDIALNNASAFGGNNASLVMKKASFL